MFNYKKKGKKTLEQKIRDIDKSFVDEVRLSTLDQVKERLIKLDKYETELLDAKKNDQDLIAKKEALKIANQTYSEPLKAIKMKRAFILKIMAEKGNK